MAMTAQEKADAKAEKKYYKKHRNQYRLKPGDIVFSIINYTVFTVFTVICIFPFYYLFINTISDNELVQRGLINFFPRGIHFDNYRRLLSVGDLFTSVIVTLARTIIGTALMVAASGFVGYLVTQKQMWKRSLWYRFIIVTMYFNAGIIPWYMNMSMLGLTNHFAAYILPGIIAPYNIILVKTYIESSIPGELEESAKLDGAGTMKIFMTLIAPLSKPILATIAIFGAVGNWNSFQDSLILMQSAPKLYTLQHRLYIYLNTASNLAALMSAGSTSGISDSIIQNVLNGKVIKYTISMVTIIPILCVYPFMQRYFEKGIMLGAVKG
jgi:multiple sugar transport system permease protein/putative aldouronate transport system permease protein